MRALEFIFMWLLSRGIIKSSNWKPPICTKTLTFNVLIWWSSILMSLFVAKKHNSMRVAKNSKQAHFHRVWLWVQIVYQNPNFVLPWCRIGVECIIFDINISENKGSKQIESRYWSYVTNGEFHYNKTCILKKES